MVAILRRGCAHLTLVLAAVGLFVSGAACQKMPSDQRVERFLTVFRELGPQQRQVALRAVVFSEETSRSRPDPGYRLERLVREYRGMTPLQKEAALRGAAASSQGGGAAAEYGLGNIYYATASDSAAAGKSAEPAAIALLDSARVHFERAVAVDSTLVEAYVNLGSVDDDLSTHVVLRDRMKTQLDQQNAEKAYRKAIALRPEDEKARCNLGALYVRVHRDADALAQFKEVLARIPDSALAHYNLAIMFADSKMYREAVREWQAAADDDPDGDIGRRSRQNVKIVEQMMAAPVPKNLGESSPAPQTPAPQGGTEPGQR